MQLPFPQRASGKRVLRGLAGLLFLASAGSVVAGPGVGGSAEPFRLDFRPVALVTCPVEGELPRSLLNAAACGDLKRVEARLIAGTDLGATDARAPLKGRTALHHAVQRGEIDLVRALLAAGADPNASDSSGNTPLHLLSLRPRSEKEVEIARALLEAGADGRLKNHRGRTALLELLQYEKSAIDPRRLDAQPLAVVLDEAEAKGPGGRGAAVAVVAASSASSLVPVQAVAAPRAAAAEAPVADRESSVRGVLAKWADAWSSGDVDAYLGHYGAAFRPADGRSLDSWRALRRERVGSAKGIEVKLSDVRVQVDGERAVAQFRQDYRSDALKSVDQKTVVLVAEGEGWRIVEERTSR